MSNEPRRVLIVDYWSDRNRGDAAMQIATAELTRKYLPQAHITVMAAYGWNQYPALESELDETAGHVDALVGGFRPTFTPISGSGISARIPRKAVSLLATVASKAIMPFWGTLLRRRRSRVLLPRRLQRSLEALAAADLVIWNGRNFRSDEPRREAYEVWQLLYNPSVCMTAGVPVVMIGASVWPLSTKRAKRSLSRAIESTAFTSVREQNSFEQVSMLPRGRALMARVKQLPDLSFAALRSSISSSNPSRTYPERPVTVALTVVDWPNLGAAVRDSYVQGVAGLCKHLLGSGTEWIDIIPQVTYEMESTSKIQAELIELVGEQLRVATGRPEVRDLASAYSGYDFLIATRMHSAIFATCMGVPVMTIPYDSGGKWGILDTLGVSDVDTPYDFASTESLVRRFEEVWLRRYEIRESVSQRLPGLLSDVDDNIRIAVELTEGWKP